MKVESRKCAECGKAAKLTITQNSQLTTQNSQQRIYYLCTKKQFVTFLSAASRIDWISQRRAVDRPIEEILD
jgi:hypothetical protein